ncbi:MAG: hypothetical protein K0Q95_2462 [Bacteroidota bacterium]|jgi:hypothetical protein|nr:hypothetical protein [Bacteroidota bacterium]
METNGTKLSIALLTIATIFGACKKEEIRPLLSKDISDKSQTVQPPQKTMVANDVETEDEIVKSHWKISNFNPNQKVMMSKENTPLKDYIFEFNKYDVVIAKHPSGAISGKWNLVKTKDGSSVVVLDFGKNPFIVMNSHWKIKQLSAQYLDMYNEMDGQLAFVKVVEGKESPQEK